MVVWRPAQEIRVVSIGLAWRADQLLVFKVTDDAGALIGVRPTVGFESMHIAWARGQSNQVNISSPHECN